MHKHIDNPGWRRVLTQPTSLAQRCTELIALARGNGSIDDATVLLVQRTGFTLPRPRWMAHAGAASDAPRNAP